MLPRKSQPDFGWLFAFLTYQNLDNELSLSPNGLLGRFSVPELPLPGLVMPGSNAPVSCRSGGNHAEGPLTNSANSHTRPGADGLAIVKRNQPASTVLEFSC